MDPMIKNSICGICNLDIATGTQMKILTYMSYGLPCVSSDLSFKNTFFKRNKEILVYKNSDDFLKIIRKLKNNKIFSNQISRSSYQALKKNIAKVEYFLLTIKLFSLTNMMKNNRSTVSNI